jgi:hypothetical protein
MKEHINKSFEQLAKDAQSKKRMQELAGIGTMHSAEKPLRDLLLDMIDEIKKIGHTVSTELKKRKELGNE